MMRAFGLASILDRAKGARQSLSRDELAYLISLSDPVETKALHEAAYEVKVRHSGKLVNLRGIIEMGNICAKDCYYCGIRKGNEKTERFELDEPAILRAVQRNIDLRPDLKLVTLAIDAGGAHARRLMERAARESDEEI